MSDKDTPLQFNVATEADLEGARRLLDDNFRGTLAEDDMKDGFISIRFSLEELKEMSRDGITIVAVSGETTAGVLCTQSCDYNIRNVPLAARMVEELSGQIIDGVEIDPNKSLVCGPVVVAKEFRGLGIFQRMYEELKTEALGKYSIAVTLVSQSNPRSSRAHEKIGFQKMTSFESDGRIFDGFAMRFDNN